jgi:hypothetical protein
MLFLCESKIEIMAQSFTLPVSKLNLKAIAIDVFALAFIYFVPTISHLLNLPVYLIEPMRIMLILAIAHSTKRNAYIIALSLPLFSYVISMHPNFYKMMLITAELVFNVWLFYFFVNKMGNKFTSMLLSIIVSKVFYYAVKFLLISLLVLDTGLISTPIYLQLTTTFVFSGYIYLMLRNKNLTS